MKRTYASTSFRKILIPVVPRSDCRTALAIARSISADAQIQLIGLVGIPDDQALTLATRKAKQIRVILQDCLLHDSERIRERVRVSHQPWEELVREVTEEKPDLVLLEWPVISDTLIDAAGHSFQELPCDLAIFHGRMAEVPHRMLTVLGESIHSQFALRLSLAIARHEHARITPIKVNPARDEQLSMRGLENVLKHLPEVELPVLETKSLSNGLQTASGNSALVILGISSQPGVNPQDLPGEIAILMRESKQPVIAVRTHNPLVATPDSQRIGQEAISILVDKWFAENTYQADEFSDLETLLALKKQRGVTISLALPALNEEQTVGNVITTIKTPLMDEYPILDEIVLMDSNSTDRTREIAESLGVPVYIHQDILPDYGARPGKGEALWKSLYVTRGDIILWIDTDIVNIHPRFIYGLLGPLLVSQHTNFVKGFYRRPLRVGQKIQAGGGGRVTELIARPMLNLFYPELSGIVQPLSGEYGGTREALEKVAFSSGYGVEIGLLIDLFERFGLKSIAQVDLQKRVHHNQPLDALSRMSFMIIQTIARRLERRFGWQILEEVNRSMKLIRYQKRRYFLDVEEIPELERPPMASLPEYGARA